MKHIQLGRAEVVARLKSGDITVKVCSGTDLDDLGFRNDLG
jgi:hypothetical protein